MAAVDALVVSFENNTYTKKHVESLLEYMLALPDDDVATIAAISKVLGYCTKDFVKAPIIAALSKNDINSKVKTALITACWESGIDYSEHITLFTQALLSADEGVAIEAYTVITEMTNSHPELKRAIEEIAQTDQQLYPASQRILINDSLNHLINLYNH